MALLLNDVQPGAGHLLLHLAAGEFAVLGIFGNVKIDRAVDLIGITVLKQLFHQFDLLRDVAAGARRDIRPQHIQLIHGFKIRGGVFLHQLHGLYLFARSTFENAVLAGIQHVAHIGDVLHVPHPIAQPAEITNHHIKADITFGMADVRIIVDRRAADIHVDASGLQRLKFFFLPGQGVVDVQGHGVSDLMKANGSQPK
ncbi:MAG: hypothetical protein BWY83_01891 [bacterium ADurb.Bin478]|nr:MAG: hypothetical protein BWY83_01891 [bacterium ADurb.Bin478]